MPDSTCVTKVSTSCTLLTAWDYVLVVFGAVGACMCCCMCYARTGREGGRYYYRSRRRGFFGRRRRGRNDDEAAVLARPNENVTIYGAAEFPGDPTYARLAERAAPGGPDSLEALVAEADAENHANAPVAKPFGNWDPNLTSAPTARAIAAGGGGGGGGGGTAAERIAALEAVRAQGSITQEEFDAQKARILQAI